jgi:broad specificity phosphatase PhoE
VSAWQSSDVPRPVVYYVRHGLTDWNVEQRLQGRRDIPLNELGRAQAVRCGEILRDLFDRDGRVSANLAYVSSPLVRARETMELMRSALGLHPAQYDIDARLAEISLGEWEGLTYADILARDKDVLAARASDKWSFLPPAGESYAQVARRMGEWYETVQADTVVSAHGGTARALIAYFAIAPPQDAPHYSIDQGVLYVFADNRITRHE